MVEEQTSPFCLSGRCAAAAQPANLPRRQGVIGMCSWDRSDPEFGLAIPRLAAQQNIMSHSDMLHREDGTFATLFGSCAEVNGSRGVRLDRRRLSLRVRRESRGRYV